MTTKEIVYSILNIARGGNTNDDERISYRQIRFHVNTWRAKLIKEYIQKHGGLLDSLIQDLGCVPIACVEDCCNTTTGCEKRRTAFQLPKVMDVSTSSRPLIYVFLVDGITPIPIRVASTISFDRYNRFTGKNRKAWFSNNHIYIDTYESDPIEFINIKAVLFDPTEAAEYKKKTGDVCVDDVCATDDDPYPAPPWLVQTIIQGVLEKELNLLLATSQINDTLNDSVQDRQAHPNTGQRNR